jgi:hypothetical protein
MNFYCCDQGSEFLKTSATFPGRLPFKVDYFSRTGRHRQLRESDPWLRLALIKHYIEKLLVVVRAVKAHALSLKIIN